MLSQELANERIPELRFLRSGKARDIYDIGDDRLLIVATDRISAFDCVLPTAIPIRGGRSLNSPDSGSTFSRLWSPII